MKNENWKVAWDGMYTSLEPTSREVDPDWDIYATYTEARKIALAGIRLQIEDLQQCAKLIRERTKTSILAELTGENR